MKSKIAEAIHLVTQPVAVYRSKTCPENALQFQEGVWGCVISMLNAAAEGKTAAFHETNVACKGGQAGLGLNPFTPGVIEYYLSTGEKGPLPGERYKKSPELALEYINNVPEVDSPDYVVFQPLDQLGDSEPEMIVFLVNADQLSGLATLANYDQPTQDNVKLNFGSGCVQAIRYALAASRDGKSDCFIGLTDPSARKCIDKNLMSFSIPYRKFLEMEGNVENCFLITDTWKKISDRI